MGAVNLNNKLERNSPDPPMKKVTRYILSPFFIAFVSLCLALPLSPAHALRELNPVEGPQRSGLEEQLQPKDEERLLEISLSFQNGSRQLQTGLRRCGFKVA